MLIDGEAATDVSDECGANGGRDFRERGGGVGDDGSGDVEGVLADFWLGFWLGFWGAATQARGPRDIHVFEHSATPDLRVACGWWDFGGVSGYVVDLWG